MLIRTDEIWMSKDISKFCDIKINENYVLFSDLSKERFPNYDLMEDLTYKPNEKVYKFNYKSLIKLLSSKDHE
jgi:hypothetical protein